MKIDSVNNLISSYSLVEGYAQDFYCCKSSVRKEIRRIDKKLGIEDDFDGSYFIVIEGVKTINWKYYSFWAFSSESRAKLGVEEIMVQLIHAI